MDILVALSGVIDDKGEEYTESKLNVRKDGSHRNYKNDGR